MKKHFVIFYSPGTFVSETTTLPIDKWDVEVAKTMALGITERHGATPYGFKFITKHRTESELDSKISKTSNMYFLGGKIRTYEMILLEDKPEEMILRDNMRFNKYSRVLENTNSYKITLPIDDDVVLDWNCKNE